MWTSKIHKLYFTDCNYCTRLYKAKGHGRPFGQPCDVGDRMGCGIKFEQVKDDAAALRHVVPVFFTKNGKEVDLQLRTQWN